jgi:MFS family permease
MNGIFLQTRIPARGIVLVVMLCHFIAAFAALGMPPFFVLILEKSLHGEARYLAGWFYVVPTLFAALSSPWWGSLADRFGRKPMLIRAQIGLAASFLLAGFATQTWIFFIALVLQGVLGGTFAASNAYLATVVNGKPLTQSLTAMQWSARAALVVAPACLGLWASIDSPIILYRYLALLPLLAALLIACLPNCSAAGGPVGTSRVEAAIEATARQIYMLQFSFVFATVVTFPYFITHVHQQFPDLSTSTAGLLFGLPHLVYLLIAMPLTRWIGKSRLLATAGFAYVALAAATAGQIQPQSLEWLVIFRLLMGMAMTVGFIALHALVSGLVKNGTAGRTFGWFESSSKWGGVFAGLGASLATSVVGTSGPFIVGTVVTMSAAVFAMVLTRGRLHLNKSF